MPIFPIPGNVVTGGIIQATDVSNLYNDINGLLDYQNIASGGLRGGNIASNTVSISNIKTAQTSVGVQQVAAKHFGGAFILLPAGAFAFFIGISTDNTATTQGSIGGNVVNDTDATFTQANLKGIEYVQFNTVAQPLIWLAVLNAATTGTNQAFMTANYISASPPYDLGDGEIPLFVFVAVDVAGIPRITWIGEDPPWARNHKPKLILPSSLSDAVSDKSKFDAYMTALDGHIDKIQSMNDLDAQIANASTRELRKTMADRFSSLQSQTFDTTPLTQEEKNAGMAMVPHPFCIGNDLTGLTVTMLNPHSKNCERLALLMKQGENVNALIHDGHIVLDNVALDKKSPSGVMVVDHKFKNSGG